MWIETLKKKNETKLLNEVVFIPRWYEWEQIKFIWGTTLFMCMAIKSALRDFLHVQLSQELR